jgi:hypothetical protein
MYNIMAVVPTAAHKLYLYTISLRSVEGSNTFLSIHLLAEFVST